MWCLAVPLFSQQSSSEKLRDMSLEDLLNVQVSTAGRRQEKVSAVPASVVILTRTDIERYGFQTLEEVLQNIPGLYLIDDYLNRNFGVRGFWSADGLRNMIIQVNGISQREYMGGVCSLELINVPVEAIDRVEVIRGPMSVMYGNGAFFGVINIITNEISDRRANLAAVSGGSDSTVRAFLRMAGEERGIRYSFNGSYQTTNGYDIGLSGLGVPDSSGGAARGLYGGNRAYVNFSGTFRNFTFDGSYSHSGTEQISFAPPVEDGTQMEWNAAHLRLGYHRAAGRKASLKAGLHFFKQDWYFDYDFLVPGLYGVQHNGSAGYEAELNLVYDPLPRLNLLAGFNTLRVSGITCDYDVPYIGLHNVRNGLADGSALSYYSLYSQINVKLTGKLSLVGGLRLEANPDYTLENTGTSPSTGTSSTHHFTYSHSGLECIPRLALIYQPRKNQIVKLLYGKAIDRPSFFQNMDHLHNYGLNLPTLAPQTIQTIEFNYLANPVSWLALNFSVFHNELDQLIYRTVRLEAGNLVSYHANVGQMATNGLEFTVNAKPRTDVELDASLTYQSTGDQRPGMENIEPGYSPHWLGYFKASWAVSRYVRLSLNGVHTGPMETYWDSSLAVPGRLGNRVAGYTSIWTNVHLTGLLHPQLFFDFQIANLLNEEIRYPATSNSSWAPRGTVAKGRTFMIRGGFRF